MYAIAAASSADVAEPASGTLAADGTSHEPPGPIGAPPGATTPPPARASPYAPPPAAAASAAVAPPPAAAAPPGPPMYLPTPYRIADGINSPVPLPNDASCAN